MSTGGAAGTGPGERRDPLQVAFALLLAGVVLSFPATMAKPGTSTAGMVLLSVSLVAGVGCIVAAVVVAIRARRRRS